ncbi:hypothetical protein, variant [Verruconis gallopava]|uniref:Uncharacterized protein n=1 Tax=Verruconis gallopava TaxID=253628 RepID=A0A0D2A233_9PEZI|nr:hypothetical protein, variant [Verruconis gallopava]KIW00823.1 hypothetical protein, variant [Verruconis gallopava]
MKSQTDSLAGWPKGFAGKEKSGCQKLLNLGDDYKFNVARLVVDERLKRVRAFCNNREVFQRLFRFDDDYEVELMSPSDILTVKELQKRDERLARTASARLDAPPNKPRVKATRQDAEWDLQDTLMFSGPPRFPSAELPTTQADQHHDTANFGSSFLCELPATTVSHFDDGLIPAAMDSSSGNPHMLGTNSVQPFEDIVQPTEELNALIPTSFVPRGDGDAVTEGALILASQAHMLSPRTLMDFSIAPDSTDMMLDDVEFILNATSPTYNMMLKTPAMATFCIE